MYFVDRNKIEQRLLYFENQIRLFEEQKVWKSEIEVAALERVLHMMIEALLDVGNSMIDGFIMRDPGSYNDIIEILEDERVITNEMCESYKKVVALRKILQQEYTEVNHGVLLEVFQQELPLLKQFTPSVRAYLQSELGSVNAFVPS